MRTLIVSIYDGAYGFSVYDNGKVYSRDEIENDPMHKFNDLWKLAYSYSELDKYLIYTFSRKYDQMFVCDNGEIQVVKGKVV